MQTSQFSFKKSTWLLLPLAIAVFSLLSISSCDDKKDEKTVEKGVVPSCMTLTNTQLSPAWIPKYTNPKNKETEKITILKFYTTYDPGSDGFEVSVRAFNRFNVQLGNPISLNEGVACASNLPPVLLGQSNDIDLSALNILKADGTLIDDFVKIILTPMPYEYGATDLLQYEVAVVVGDRTTERPNLLPCPPCQNCKPIPDGCIIINDSTKDNTAAKVKSDSVTNK